MTQHHQGWVPDYNGIEQCLLASSHPDFGTAWRASGATFQEKDTFLYEYLLRFRPNYKRGAQGIGDCVSWGAELALTILLAREAYLTGDPDVFVAEAATEPIYGGSRVEARGYPGDGAKAYGGFSDGSYGAAAAKWCRDGGCLLRLDYSQETGSKDDDLRVYSAEKAKQWGAYGNGGQGDKGLLDGVAKKRPLQEYSQVKTFDDAAKAIAGLKAPVICGSNQGFSMALDPDGFWRASGSWAHLMVFIGVRFDRPGLLIAQSWGPNTTTKLENRWPSSMPTNIAGFTGWVDSHICEKMFTGFGGDSFALIGKPGHTTDAINFSFS